MTWTKSLGKATIWVLPNALAMSCLIVLFYIVGVADPGVLEGVVRVLVIVSFFCVIAVPVAAGLVHRSGKVALVAALCEVAAVGALTGLYFDFFGGWVPRGFHP